MQRSPRILVCLGCIFLAADLLAQVPAQQARPIVLGGVRRGIGLKAAVPVQDDEATLRSASLKPDDAETILNYFRKRTLSDADLNRIQSIIQRMGDEQFEVRRKASEELYAFGPASIGALRNASTTEADYEIAFRATEILKKIEEKVSHASVAAAGARILKKLSPPETCAVLLGFLPMADNSLVEDEIRSTLAAVAVKNDTLSPALLEALKDKQPIRRSAAVMAITTAASLDPKGPAKAVQPQLRETLSVEKDLDARFRMAVALSTIGRDPVAVEGLIDLMPDLIDQRGRLWQVEDILLQVAGDDAPKAKLTGERAGVELARSQWKEWWSAKKVSHDLGKFDYEERTTGRLVLLAMNNLQYGQGRLIQFAPDSKQEWSIGSIYSPADFRVTSEGKIWVLEQNSYRIIERDRQLQILQKWQATQGPPMAFDLRENGNLIVAYQRLAVEYDPKNGWREVNRYVPANQLNQQFEIKAVASRGSGPIYLLVVEGSMSSIVRLDEKWKPLAKPQRTGTLSIRPKIDIVDSDRVLVTEQNAIVEYDFKKADQKPGEGVWSVPVSNPTSVQRLPNGNTLTVDSTGNKLREFAPDKKEVWSRSSFDGLRLVGAELR